MAKKYTQCYHAPSGGFFEIPNVKYQGAGTYHLLDNLTSSMTQDKLAKAYNTEHPLNAPEQWAIFEAATKLKGKIDPNEFLQLMKFIQSGLQKYPNTLTRVAYSPDGNDKVVHNYGTAKQYEEAGKIVGPDNWVTDIPDKKSLTLLLGNEDTTRINQVSQAVNGTNTYLWRVNEQPSETDERVVWLIANSYRLCVGANRGPQVEYPAFRGIRVA